MDETGNNGDLEDPQVCVNAHDDNTAEIEKLRIKATEMLAQDENFSLQSLDYYSKILDLNPEDVEALKARISTCISMKLFHRCLHDIEVLATITPQDIQVHTWSGLVHEKIGSYEQSFLSYLNAYLLDSNEDRLEIAKKINEVVCRLTGNTTTDNDNLNTFEHFLQLSKVLYKEERYRCCFELIRTALVVFYWRVTLLGDELASCLKQDAQRARNTNANYTIEDLLEQAETKPVTKYEHARPDDIHGVLLDASECCRNLGLQNTAVWLAEQSFVHALVSQDITSVLTSALKLAILHGGIEGNEEVSISYHTWLRAKCRVEMLKDSLKEDEQTRFLISHLEKENLMQLCILFKGVGLYQEAHQFAEEYFTEVDMVEHENLIRAYGILGELEYQQGFHQQAIQSYETELALCQKFRDNHARCVAYHHLGMVHKACGHHVLARQYHESHLQLAITLGDTASQSVAFGDLGELSASQNEHEKAVEFFKKELSLATLTKQRRHALRCLGESYKHLRLLQHSEVYLKRALQESGEEQTAIIQSVSEVQLTLGKASEVLPPLVDSFDHIETKFNKIRQNRIITRHPLLDDYHRCLDNVLVALATLGRYDDALNFVERANGLTLRQMLQYQAVITPENPRSLSDISHRSDIHEIIRSRRKAVLVYHPVENGYMCWALSPFMHGVVHFHWYKAPIGVPFVQIIQGVINELLKPTQTFDLSKCDHRRLGQPPEAPPQPPCTDKNDTTITNALKQLSTLFITPVEKIFDKNLQNVDLVIVKSSYLNMVPLADLQTSSGENIQDLVKTVQLLPCISVLEILDNKPRCDKSRPMRVIGNPEMKAIPGEPPWTSDNSQLNLLTEELSSTADLLGVENNVGHTATKEHFLKSFSDTSVLHLATHGCHSDGIIALAPASGVDPRTINHGSWAITLEDIVGLQHGPELLVLNSCYGVRHRFRELRRFTQHLALAFMVAGTNTIVMPTWSLPQNVLLDTIKKFYRNLSLDTSVAQSLRETKRHFQNSATCNEPFFWTSFQLYGQDCTIPVRELQHSHRESAFDKAQGNVVGRFDVEQSKYGGKSRVADCLVKEILGILHHHHTYPKLLPILRETIQEASRNLKRPPNGTSPTLCSLPYREVTNSWVTQLLTVKNLLNSLGFMMKRTNNDEILLIYPHWDEKKHLERVDSLLQSTENILSRSVVTADALRIVLLQEDKDITSKLSKKLEDILSSSPNVSQLNVNVDTVLRMIWLKASTRRFLKGLGFRQIGNMLEYNQELDDVVQSCLHVFASFREFDDDLVVEPNALLEKVNLDAPWMTHRADVEENQAKLGLVKRLEEVQCKYKRNVRDVITWHENVLETQASVLEAKKTEDRILQREKSADLKDMTSDGLNTSECETERCNTDTTERFAKIKVERGSSQSCPRVPIMVERPLPLVELVMERHKCFKILYKNLNDIECRKQEDIRDLFSK